MATPKKTDPKLARAAKALIKTLGDETAAAIASKLVVTYGNQPAALALSWLEPIMQIPTLTLIFGLAGLPILGLLALLPMPCVDQLSGKRPDIKRKGV